MTTAESLRKESAASGRQSTQSHTAHLQRALGNQIFGQAVEAASAVQSGNGAVTFQLAIEGVVYEFHVKKDTSRPGKNYRLTAVAPNSMGAYADGSVVYQAFVSVTEAKGKRTINGGLSVTLQGVKYTKKKDIVDVHLEVAAGEIEKAWDSASPVPKSAHDFVVLMVHDAVTKAKPWSLVFWMGEGVAPPPEQARIAWYNVQNKELEDLAPGQFAARVDEGKERLTTEDVAELVRSKTAVKESLTGFDMNSFAGYRVKTTPVEVQSKDGTAPVTFDVAAGKVRPNHTATYQSFGIAAPPIQIASNFMSGEWAIPGGLEATSAQELQDKFRLVLLYLHDHPGVNLKIYGDTDAVGTDLKNDDLSQRRADEAKRFLSDSKAWPGSPGPLDAGRIDAEGRGSELAKSALKEKRPNDYDKIIGTKAAEDPAFRRFRLAYVVL